MLIRDQRIYYRLWTVFTHGSFVLKNYKTLSEGSELALSPVEGLERVIVNLTAPMRVDGRSLSEMDMIYVPREREPRSSCQEDHHCTLLRPRLG